MALVLPQVGLLGVECCALGQISIPPEATGLAPLALDLHSFALTTPCTV